MTNVESVNIAGTSPFAKYNENREGETMLHNKAMKYMGQAEQPMSKPLIPNLTLFIDF